MDEDNLVRFGDLFTGKRLWDTSGLLLSPTTYIRVDENGNPIRNDAGHLIGPVESDPSDIVLGVANLPQIDFVYNTQTGLVEPTMNVYSNDERAIQEAYLQEQEANRLYLLSDLTPSWMLHDIYLGDEVGNNPAADTNANAYIQNQISQNNWLNKYYADKYRNDEYKTWGSILAGGAGVTAAAGAAPVVAPFMPLIIGDVALGTAIDQVPTLWGDKSISETISEGANNLLGTDPNSWQGQLVGGVANLANPSYWISGGITNHLANTAAALPPFIAKRSITRLNRKGKPHTSDKIEKKSTIKIGEEKYKVASYDKETQRVTLEDGSVFRIDDRADKINESLNNLKHPDGTDFPTENRAQLINEGSTTLYDPKTEMTYSYKIGDDGSIITDKYDPMTVVLTTSKKNSKVTIDKLIQGTEIYDTYDVKKRGNLLHFVSKKHGRGNFEGKLTLGKDGLYVWQDAKYDGLKGEDWDLGGIKFNSDGDGLFTIDYTNSGIEHEKSKLATKILEESNNANALLTMGVSLTNDDAVISAYMKLGEDNLTECNLFILEEIIKNSPAKIRKMWRNSGHDISRFGKKINVIRDNIAKIENNFLKSGITVRVPITKKRLYGQRPVIHPMKFTPTGKPVEPTAELYKSVFGDPLYKLGKGEKPLYTHLNKDQVFRSKEAMDLLLEQQTLNRIAHWDRNKYKYLIGAPLGITALGIGAGMYNGYKNDNDPIYLMNLGYELDNNLNDTIPDNTTVDDSVTIQNINQLDSLTQDGWTLQ